MARTSCRKAGLTWGASVARAPSLVYFIFFEVNRNLSYTLRIGFYVRLIVVKMNLLSYGQGDAYGSLLFDKGTCEKLLSLRVGGFNH